MTPGPGNKACRQLRRWNAMYADVNDEVMSGLQETMRQNVGVAFIA